MSTQYKLGHGLELDEISSKFDLDFNGGTILYSLTAEEVIDIAIKMLQPVLYNVKDPKQVKAEILGRVEKLYE